MTGRRRAALVALALLATGTGAAPPVGPRAAGPAEYEVLSQVLVQFASFTDWPPLRLAGDEVPFVVCLWGEDPMETWLRPWARAPLRRHPVEIRRPTVDELGVCHALWIAPTDPTSLRALLLHTTGRPILTAGATPGYHELGVILEVEPRPGGSVMRVNLPELKKSGLVVDPRVLNLAVTSPGTR